MKVLLGYVSMSGNTEDMAKLIQKQLELANYEVAIEELDSISSQALSQYGLLLIGSYTWGDGDLPYEAEDFFDELETVNLSGIYAACFGSGDTMYPQYCAAVDLFAEKLSDRGALVFEDKLKIEFSPETEEQVKECETFALSIINWIESQPVINHV